MIAGGAAAGAVVCGVIGTVIAVKLLAAKSAVASVPPAAVYQAPQVPGSASYNSPPSNTPANQGNAGNHGLRGGQDGPANTKSKVKIPQQAKPPAHLSPMQSGPQPPAANNGLWLESELPPLPSINGQFPAPNIPNVPGPSTYVPLEVPASATY